MQRSILRTAFWGIFVLFLLAWDLKRQSINRQLERDREIIALNALAKWSPDPTSTSKLNGDPYRSHNIMSMYIDSTPWPLGLLGYSMVEERCSHLVITRDWSDAYLGRHLPHLRHMRDLAILSPRVTDRIVHTLAQMPGLVYVHLDDTAVTDKGRIELFRLNPHIRMRDYMADDYRDIGLENARRSSDVPQ